MDVGEALLDALGVVEEQALRAKLIDGDFAVDRSYELRHGFEAGGDGVGEGCPAGDGRGVGGIGWLDDNIGRFVLRIILREAEIIAEELDVGIEQLVLIGGDVELPGGEESAGEDKCDGDDEHAKGMLDDVEDAEEKWTMGRTHAVASLQC